MNNWQKIWSSRKSSIQNLNNADWRTVFSELARIDGYDVNGMVPTELLLKQYEEIRDFLQIPDGGNVFEVGCGSGMYLYMFARDGFKVGGIDYSPNMIEFLKEVTPPPALIESICAEADALPVEPKYDAVFSWGVFYYFNDLEYASRVLEKMIRKSTGTVAVLDVYDKALETECMAYRRKHIENYDERYKGLAKLFYPRNFFQELADKYNMSIRFEKNNLKEYDNAPFTFHVYMKRENLND